MSEWWTYSLSDFLMFSARTYFRQFALMNRALWPLQLAALGAGAVILACMLRTWSAGARMAFALLSVGWLWTGWAYHLQRYAEINTGAPYFANAFFVQAALLVWMALRRPAAPRTGLPARTATLVVVIAVAVYPLLAFLAGRSWYQAEVIGVAPDPTAVATIGAMLFWRAPWLLWVIPILWCAVSSATLMQLRAPLACLPSVLAFAGAAIGLACRSGRQQVSGTK